MKKRVIAVMLSLFMCTATVSEASAAAFTSPDVEAAGTEVQESAGDETQDAASEENPVCDFSSGASDDAGENVASDSGQEEDVFSAGLQEATDSSVVTAPAETKTTETPKAVPAVNAEGAIVVKAEDWEQTEGGFKLRKAQTVQEQTKDEQIPEAQENAVQQNGENSNTEENITDEENQTAADVTDENMSEAAMPESAADAGSVQNADAEDADFAQDTETIANAEETTANAEQNMEGPADADQTTADAAENTDQEPSADTADKNSAPDASSETAQDYYTAADGILKIATEYQGEVHTGYYLFDENGIMVTGQAEAVSAEAVMNEDAVDAAAADPENVDTDAVKAADTQSQLEQHWFTTAEEAVLYASYEGQAVTPYTSTVGQQKINTWVWTGTVFQYYGAEGVNVSIADLEKEEKQLGTYTGYFAIDGEYYCLDANGKPKTGDVTITVNGVSSLYYFETTGTIPGRMFHEGWRCVKTSKGDRWVYYNQGVKVPADIGKYYAHGTMATTLGSSMGTRKYLIDKNGYLLKSIVKKASDGAFYGTDKNGAIYTNTLVKYGNYRYYFGSNGKRVSWKRRWAKVGNHYYYFGGVPGRVEEKHGWQKLYNTSGKFMGWFYFDSNGNHYTNKVTSAGYYFTPTGKLASGLVERNGKKYMYEVSTESVRRGKMYKNTMVRYKKKWYRASSSGALTKEGWRRYKGTWYYFKNYVAQTSQFMKKDGVNGYLDANGKYTTGWVIVSNAKNLVKYIDPDGNGFATNTSKRVNGVLYYFDKNGYRITDVTNRYSGPYYLELEQVNGVLTVYTDSSKTIPVKTIRVSVGLAGTPTPNGTFTLRSSARWQPLMGPSWGQYGTHVENAGQGGIFVHSVACSQANSHNLPAGEYNKLGYPASHGCIRACVADAKWVYYNCNGATIHIINGNYKADDALKGPLGKKPLTPLRGSGNFDPTDPEA